MDVKKTKGKPMTSNLKCPFCGEEIKIAGERTTIMSCFNGDCVGSGLYGEEAMWTALIQVKQDLEQSEKCCSAWETQALDYKAETIALSGKLEIARKALEELWQATHYDTNGYLGETISKALETIGKHNE